MTKLKWQKKTITGFSLCQWPLYDYSNELLAINLRRKGERANSNGTSKMSFDFYGEINCHTFAKSFQRIF